MKAKPTTVKSIDAYIAGFPPEVQAILRKIRAIIHAAAPKAEEAIKYQIPTFVLHENLVHFAAFRKHIGFYPTSSGIEQFKDALAAYHIGRGSVQFPLDKPIPYPLIQRIVKFRVREVGQRMAAKAKEKSRPKRG